MITQSNFNAASVGLQTTGGHGSVEGASVRDYFEQVLARVQAQPLRVLPRGQLSTSGVSLAQQMQREGMI